MSVSTTAHPERRGKSNAKLWLGILALIAAGVAIAWFGVEGVKANTVQVETVSAGSGPAIQAEDGVLIEYEGRLATNGTVFDTSAGRGPAPILVGQTIPGFSQALMRMQKGGRYKVFIPSKLAYGSTQQPGSPIPPNSDLEFDVQVVQVVPGEALMQGAGAPQR